MVQLLLIIVFLLCVPLPVVCVARCEWGELAFGPEGKRFSGDGPIVYFLSRFLWEALVFR